MILQPLEALAEILSKVQSQTVTMEDLQFPVEQLEQALSEGIPRATLSQEGLAQLETFCIQRQESPLPAGLFRSGTVLLVRRAIRCVQIS